MCTSVITQKAKKHKNAKNSIELFFTKSQKNPEMEIFGFCVITFEQIRI
jgi:hypothetical protein